MGKHDVDAGVLEATSVSPRNLQRASLASADNRPVVFVGVDGDRGVGEMSLGDPFEWIAAVRE